MPFGYVPIILGDARKTLPGWHAQRTLIAKLDEQNLIDPLRLRRGLLRRGRCGSCTVLDRVPHRAHWRAAVDLVASRPTTRVSPAIMPRRVRRVYVRGAVELPLLQRVLP